MKKIYVSLFLSAVIFFLNSPIFSQSNYINLGNLGTTSFCPNGTLSVPFTTNLPTGTGNIYKVLISDADGSFLFQRVIGEASSSPILTTFLSNVPRGSGYLIKIQSTTPFVTSNLSNNLSTSGQVFSLDVVTNLLQDTLFNENRYNICQGSSLTGQVVTNSITSNYEWKKDDVIISNAQSYKITQPGNYVVTATKVGCGNAIKNLQIYFTPTINNFYGRQGNLEQCAGTSIRFSTGYYSDSALYRWKKNGDIILGQNSRTLLANQSGVYQVEITDKCPVIEDPSILPDNKKVIFANSIQSSIIYSGGTSTNLCGSQITGVLYSSVPLTPINPIAPFSYQWKKNGIDILGKIQQNLYPIIEPGIYSLALKQGDCTSISNGIIFTKSDTIKLGLTLDEFSSDKICPDTYTILNSLRFGNANYNLFKNGILLPSSYVNNIPYLYVFESGNYTLSASADGCVVIPSDTVNIEVTNSLKPRIDDYRSKICSGTNASLTVIASGFLYSATYQWYKNGLFLSGENTSRIYPSQPGFYKARITQGLCSGITDSVQVKIVTSFPKGQLSVSYESNQLIYSCSNNILLLSDLNSKGIVYDSLIWKKDGQIIARRRNANYEGQIKTSQSGTYTLTGKQGTCLSPESDPVEIKIGEPITANITGSTSIYPGQKAKLNLNFTGGNAWSYQTSDVATGQTTSLSPTLKDVSPASTQTYSITSVASNCGVGTVTGDATVTVLPCPTDKTISLNSGNWNTATTWACGQIPTAAYDAIIENGHTVTLPNGYQGITKKLDLRGGLKQGVGAGVRVSN